MILLITLLQKRSYTRNRGEVKATLCAMQEGRKKDCWWSSERDGVTWQKCLTLESICTDSKILLQNWMKFHIIPKMTSQTIGSKTWN